MHAVEAGGESHDGVSAGEDLALGQRAVGGEDLGDQLVLLSSVQALAEWPSPALGVDGPGQLRHRPAHGLQLGLPAGHELTDWRAALLGPVVPGDDPFGPVAVIAPALGLGGDLGRPLGVGLHDFLGHSAMAQCPSRPEGPGSGVMP